MKKVLCAAAASTFMLTAIAPNMASAVPAPVPVVPVIASSSTAGAAATGGFIGFVGFLAAYDLVRRTTCIGDPLQLGGPGFSEPMPEAGNVMIPQCQLAAHKGKRKRH